MTTQPLSSSAPQASAHPARHGRVASHDLPDPYLVHPELIAPETPAGRVARYLGALTRISLGWVFLWAFLDKTFSLGHETVDGKGWLDGGSPTAGFLGKAAAGPFQDAYNSLAGAGWADALFMAGLLGIGVGLLLGVAMRLSAACGALLLVLMWTAVLPPANNPFMDYHLVYALVLGMLALTGAGSTLGLGERWARLSLVRRLPVLR